MLYYIFRAFERVNMPGAHLWSYISFRALCSFLLALIVSFVFAERFIAITKRKGISETPRDPVLDPFAESKKGIPTMGGIIIILSILLPVLLFARLRNIYLLLMIITTIWLGMLGILDDYIKVFKHNKQGLKPKYKIIGQVGLGLLIGLTLYFSPETRVVENTMQECKSQVLCKSYASPMHSSLKTTIPFVKGHNLDYISVMSCFGKYKQEAGFFLFVMVVVLCVSAVSNGANLNDGLDGMCAGVSAIVGVVLGILSYVSSHVGLASYLNIMYVPGSQELVIFMCAFVGALIGFIWYNAFPAQVFMGDVGSLTIGGIIAVCAIIIHKELLLPILCGVFLMESVSVIVQVWCYKIAKRRGKKCRVFRRTPIHDTFRTADDQLEEDCFYVFRLPRTPKHESKITVRFWIVGLILAALTLITLKIR